MMILEGGETTESSLLPASHKHATAHQHKRLTNNFEETRVRNDGIPYCMNLVRFICFVCTGNHYVKDALNARKKNQLWLKKILDLGTKERCVKYV